MEKHKNHLQHETSPYLLQHADNPVDWYPWNETSIAKAQLEAKPLLVSIGYSACHWCHVMARESFEDQETAQWMNRFFINIKVDREERPELDRLYQIAHQMLTRSSGGWPLTVFLTPDDLTPFFTGTYFPKESRYGLPSFKEVLTSIERFYREQPHTIHQQNKKVREVIAHFAYTSKVAASLEAPPLKKAITDLLQDYDPLHGGFGGAPKFPQPSYIQRLLHHSYYHQEPSCLAAAVNILSKMAMGGIYDHLGGGFFRYAVDAHWHIPHFEKMLYDNGQLLSLYSDAYAATHDRCFKQVLLETGAWVLREMQSPEGGYYATLDADTEHQEGRFYVWDKTHIQALLTPEEFILVQTYFNLARPANFEGQWHLHITQPLTATKEQLPGRLATTQPQLDSVRQRLLAAREQRIRPGRDEKILTSWNGLMIQGLALAGLRLHQLDFIESAQRAVDFIQRHHWQKGRLLASSKDGRARFMAYLDDYAFLLNGLLALLQAQWRTKDLLFAIELANALIAHYQDAQGGFFFTAHDHERLLQRLKPYADEAIPSGNGSAAIALMRLGHLLGEINYLETAQKTLTSAWDLIQQAPAEHHHLLAALEDHLMPPEIIILRGQGTELAYWKNRCEQGYVPQRMVFAIPATESDLPQIIAQKTPKNAITAYVCQGTHCLEPVTTWDELQTILDFSQNSLLSEKK